LEAAVYEKIVLCGPYFEKYIEAAELVRTGGALSFTDNKKDGNMLAELIKALMLDKDEFLFRSKAAGNYVRANTGATQKIIDFIQEKRLLTS
jgi:3-deoxy-D-manno-octulosonic-acid transferase